MKTLLIILGIVLAIIGITGIYVYFRFFNSHPEKKAGNAAAYGPANTPLNPSSPLQGKTIIFLGSSVTYGYNNESFVEFLAAADGVHAVKEAVSGTVLVDQKVYGRDSYITRMKTIDVGIKADGFLCQLSTNDATTKKPLGQITSSKELTDFDTQTVTGALEYVIAYAKATWGCPVAFYTNSRYESKEYDAMVKRLHQLQKKWDFSILDLWNDAQMNDLTSQQRELFMTDRIHPTLAGYRDWWLPAFEKFLTDLVTDKS